jgi:hypothetical protein
MGPVNLQKARGLFLHDGWLRRRWPGGVMTTLARTYRWREEGETFPGGILSGERPRNSSKQPAPVVEKR